MPHGPDYQLTYIESLIQHLAIRGLWITPAEVLEGLWMLQAAGLEDEDAETALRIWLDRNTPMYGAILKPPTRHFAGWKAEAATIPVELREMQARYGADSMRVARIIQKKYATT